MKHCPTCKTEKPESDFGRHSKRGYQTCCRECKRRKDRESLARRRGVKLPDRKARFAALREFFRKLKKAPCMDCKVSYPYYVMEFDHVRGVKRFNLSEHRNFATSEEAILLEMEKCELVCANCHRERTHRRSQSS